MKMISLFEHTLTARTHALNYSAFFNNFEIVLTSAAKWILSEILCAAFVILTFNHFQLFCNYAQVMHFQTKSLQVLRLVFFSSLFLTWCVTRFALQLTMLISILLLLALHLCAIVCLFFPILFIKCIQGLAYMTFLKIINHFLYSPWKYNFDRKTMIDEAVETSIIVNESTFDYIHAFIRIFIPTVYNIFVLPTCLFIYRQNLIGMKTINLLFDIYRFATKLNLHYCSVTENTMISSLSLKETIFLPPDPELNKVAVFSSVDICGTHFINKAICREECTGDIGEISSIKRCSHQFHTDCNYIFRS